ncbi:MAG TPA: ATP-dependent DNA helicase RecG [Candidatus Binataceae bacterium]|nr:ATP-dependent DNA helicase RecG [Candidatus Binataceae bacterium]
MNYPLRLDSKLLAVPGIGPKRAQMLAARGLLSVGDLLLYLPTRYRDWRTPQPIERCEPGTVVTLAGELEGLSARPMRGAWGRRIVEGWLREEGGERMAVIWFNAPTYLCDTLKAYGQVVLQGRVRHGVQGRMELHHPEVFPRHQAPAIVPEYALGAELGQRLMRSLIARVLPAAAALPALVPAPLRADAGLLPPADAVRYLHQPPPQADLDALVEGTTAAHRTLALDELFAFDLALMMERSHARERQGVSFDRPAVLSTRFLKELPFALTGAQERAIVQLQADMAAPWPMNRLLLGDVGSGKTVVALWAVVRAIEHGYQAAVMAPTELLVEQHYHTFARLAGALGIRAELLSGRLGASARARVLERAARAEPMVLFGTQALIQSKVRLGRLGLAVIDEQHRFGVFDRLRLRALGPQADLLLLSATPIPRSLARVMLANLDVMRLDERPPGRASIKTEIAVESQLEQVWARLRAEVDGKHQAYCILPLIEDDDQPDLAVESAARALVQGPLAGLQVGIMHGRLSAAAKQEVMRRFRDGELAVLIATTVVEVGIDVPAASVMVVLAAERYGLAQLHQLRGRIGRGSQPSHCFLVISDRAGSSARARLQVLVEQDSGAEIAQADLQLRGPGDLFGIRQAGPLPLRFAGWLRDLKSVQTVRELANRWLITDPDLESALSQGLRQAVEQMMARAADWEQLGSAG